MKQDTHTNKVKKKNISMCNNTPSLWHHNRQKKENRMYYITAIDPEATMDDNGNYVAKRVYLAFDIHSGTRYWSLWYLEFFKNKEEATDVINDMKKNDYYRDEVSDGIDINSIEIKEFKE